MKFAIFLLAVFIAKGVYAWGGRFNRFSPEMLSNLGYGGYGRHGSQVRTAVSILLTHLLA